METFKKALFGLTALLALLLSSGCRKSEPMYVERGIAPQVGVIPDRTSLSKPYLLYGHVGFTTEGQLEEHYEKHGASFGAVSPTQFLSFAQELRDRPKDATLIEGRRFDGVLCRYDLQTGAFIAYNRNRTIRTFFKPKNGKAYFYRQMNRSH